MKYTGKNLWIMALLVGVLAGMLGMSALTEEPAAGIRDGVFIHITHGKDNPHRLLMGLKMAEIMSETRDVLVYLDITAIEVVLEDAEDIRFLDYASSNTQLTRLIAAGVPIDVCPSCLKAGGWTPADVRKGVRIADKDQFFSFTRGRILSLDY